MGEQKEMMEREMIKFVSRYAPISPELERTIIESGMVKSFDKGTLLAEPGKFSNECFFIIKGCVRSYTIKDGEERTTEFYTEEQPVSPTATGDNNPSNQFLECVEDVIAAVSTPEFEQEMYRRFPHMETVSRIMGEALMAKYVQTFAEFKMASPEERYLMLLKDRPDLMQRVPQHQIASYLGMKPESLSRIRKRIMK